MGVRGFRDFECMSLGYDGRVDHVRLSNELWNELARVRADLATKDKELEETKKKLEEKESEAMADEEYEECAETETETEGDERALQLQAMAKDVVVDVAWVASLDQALVALRKLSVLGLRRFGASEEWRTSKGCRRFLAMACPLILLGVIWVLPISKAKRTTAAKHLRYLVISRGATAIGSKMLTMIEPIVALADHAKGDK